MALEESRSRAQVDDLSKELSNTMKMFQENNLPNANLIMQLREKIGSGMIHTLIKKLGLRLLAGMLVTVTSFYFCGHEISWFDNGHVYRHLNSWIFKSHTHNL